MINRLLCAAVAVATIAACSSSGGGVQSDLRDTCTGGGNFVVKVESGSGDIQVLHQAGRVIDGKKCVSLSAYWHDLHPRVSPYCVVIAPLGPNANYNSETAMTSDPIDPADKFGDGC